ncbi:MAG: hypothetical protein ACYDFT_04790, partial [Thermoplasmata archaeon]
ASFLRPLNNTTGLVVGQPTTVVISYSGDYVSGAFFNVSNLSTGQVIYSQGIFQAGGGAHGTFALWTPATAGEFRLSISLLTPYLAPFTTSELERVAAGPPGGGTTFVNTTYWHNTTWIPGVSPAAGAAIVLVMGLVVGMVVAALLVQAVRGPRLVSARTTDRNEPAVAGAAYACTVCRQSFPSEAERAAHAKDAHGID